MLVRKPLSGRLPRRLATLLGSLALLACLSPAALAHHGSTPKVKGDPVVGKTLFRANCGNCHTLPAAGTHGKVGPNLLYASPKYSTVVWMIQTGNSLMPSFTATLKLAQIQDIAAFVVTATS